MPNGYILEPFANSITTPLIRALRPQPLIEKSVPYLDDPAGFGVEFNQVALKKYGIKVL